MTFKFLGRFFSEQRFMDLRQKAIDELIKPADKFSLKMVFTAERAKALMDYQVEFGNMIAERVIRLHDLHLMNEADLSARIKRIEQIDSVRPEPTDESQVPLYLTDQISQLRATVARLEQRLGSLQKQVVSIDRRTIT